MKHVRGVAATLSSLLGVAGMAAPAAAATRPTITASPSPATGYGPITLGGTAPARATVTLWEAAYLFRDDMNPAIDYDTGATLTTTADAAGHWSLRRIVDSGFVFAVEAGGVRSETITVRMTVAPTLTLTTSGSTVTVDAEASPGQPGLPVEIQRSSGSTWTTVADGWTGTSGGYSTVLTGQGAGTIWRYRALMGPDPANAILVNHTASATVTVGSSGPVTVGPATGTPTPPPAPKPTPDPQPTPAPDPRPTPAPGTEPRAGEVRFTRIQYDSPGTDDRSTASLNAEYVRLTNRSTRTINLRRWTVRDRAGNVYTFRVTYNLAAGRSVTVHTGRGTDGKPNYQHRYWGRTAYVWNNGGDAATLRTGSGKRIDSCGWTTGRGSTTC